MRQHAADVLLDVGCRRKALAGKVGRRARTEAEVLVAHPVFHIVAADVAVAREIGDLVLPVAERFQRFHGVEIHIRLRVVVGEVRAVLVVVERRVRLDLQTVARDVVGLEVDDVAQRLHPLLAALAGQTEHQIDRHVRKPGAPRQRHRLLRLLVGVRTTQRLELLVEVGLHADGDAVKARAAQTRKLRERDGVGIRLQRDLRVAADLEPAVQLREDAHQTARAEERRRAAAEVDGVHDIPRRAGRRLADVGEDGVEIALHERLIARAADGVEIAVFALAAAERDVYINAERLFLFFRRLFLRHRPSRRAPGARS